jgi:hypothetical protein
MQFLLYDLAEDIIHINIFDHEFFSPNGLFIYYCFYDSKKHHFLLLENIGYATIQLIDLLPCPLDTFLTQPSRTFTQTIHLNNGASVVLQCTVQFSSSSQ